MRRSRLNRKSDPRNYERLPVIKKPIYFMQWEKKYGNSPIGFIGRVEHFPPIMKTKNSQMVLLDWKTKVVKDLWGKPIGRMPDRQVLDRYCPDTIEVER